MIFPNGLERIDTACTRCGHEWLEKGYDACEGWYVCPACGHIESREDLAVRLLNQGASLPTVSVMVGLAVACIREMLSAGWHLEWFGERLGDRWVRNPVMEGGGAMA